MGSATRIGKRKIKVKIGTTEYTAEVSKAEVTSGEADNDFVTFEDAANGGARQYNLELTLAQDAATGSLWRKMWDNAGEDVAVKIAPYGSTTFTATNPGFEGTVTIKEPDGTLLGGEADASNTATQTIDVVWPFLEKPDLLDTGTF